MIQIQQQKIQINEKKSDFITYCFKISSPEDVITHLKQIKNKHPDARHIVYAYILNKDNYKYSDGGEPSSTAGKPLINVMIKNNFVYSLCIVVRYFGGIKLGAGGLIRTYPKGLKELIKQKCYLSYISTNKYFAIISVQNYNKILKLLHKYDFTPHFNNTQVELELTLSFEQYQQLKPLLNLQNIEK